MVNVGDKVRMNDKYRVSEGSKGIRGESRATGCMRNHVRMAWRIQGSVCG